MDIPFEDVCKGMRSALVFAAMLAALPAIASADGYATYRPVVLAAPNSRPVGASCTVALLRGERFANGETPHRSAYAPRCPGPWAKIVLRWRTRIAGRQYDRFGGLWIGGREIYRFTTAEPTKHGIDYTVVKDVTDYAPILRSPQTVLAELGNYTNASYDGIFMIDADLTFYRGATPPGSPDDVVAVSDANGKRPWFALDTPTDEADVVVRDLPRNVEHARLDLYSTSHACDEFWYTNQPDAYVAAHPKDGLCGGGAYREIDVWIDGTLASVVYPFPWIYTGGIDPILWRPIPAIDALNVPPYRVDLDPFAGVLSDGAPHRIEIAVRNDRGDWPTDADLFLWRDPHAKRTGGRVVAVRSADAQRPAEARGSRSDRFSTTATGSWSVVGYVDTSHGRVTHGVSQAMTFSNRQSLTLETGSSWADQVTSFATTTTTQNATGRRTSRRRSVYGIAASSEYPPQPKDGPYDLVIGARVVQSRRISTASATCEQRIASQGTYRRAKVYADSKASGTSQAVDRCTGPGSHRIVKRSRDGSLY